MFFSVVIPMYNRATVISRALNSVLKQTFQNFEIVVVDDGSKDNSVEVVKGYKDPRIRLVTQKNSGATAARNRGIIESKGEYVSFLDSDDEWKDTMLEKQYEQYQSNPQIGCVYSNVNIIDNNGNIHDFGLKLGVKGNAYSKVLEQGYLAPTSILSAKKDLLLKVGMFDIQLPASQDDDMCFKLAKESNIGYISEVQAYMYLDTNNRITDSKGKVANGWWMLWNKYEDDVIKYCGNRTMVKHYLMCVRYFAIFRNIEGVNNALAKAKQFGGHLSIVQSIGLRFAFLNNSFCNKIGIKLLKIG